MTANLTHPTPAQLSAFGNGRLNEKDMRAVAAHLGTCDICRRAVENLRAAPRQETVNASAAGALPNQTGFSGAKASPPPGLPAALADHSRYRVVKELGRGGMGVVYEAEHRLMDRRVALKLINRAVLDHPDALARFHTEVRNAAKLHHPNIVTAFDAEQAGDLHMLVMEYVEGSDLAKVLGKRGSFPILNACHYVRQAALGLQHAFEKGMIHRDVKPQNLMLTPQGQVKVLDFGLARVTGERAKGGGLTQDGAFMGTPEYMSPEQAVNARTADTRADVYSLGCTLYAFLAGRPPFREETVMMTALAQIEKEPPPLPRLRPEVSAELWSVVAAMLAKDPEQRYPTPGDVARALTPFLKAAPAKTREGGVMRKPNGSPTQAAPFEELTDEAPLPRKPVAKPRRSRLTRTGWQIGLGAAGIFAVLTGIILVSIGGGPPDEKKPVVKPDNPPAPERVVTNSIGMKLALIPKGTFVMGSPKDEEERQGDEEQHEVEITKPFYMGVYTVTQEEYKKVMEPVPAKGGGKDKVAGMDDTLPLPADRMTWHDAVAFCRKLSERPEEKRAWRMYRLPTEAEWEYACRAGTTTKYSSEPVPKGPSAVY